LIDIAIDRSDRPSGYNIGMALQSTKHVVISTFGSFGDLHPYIAIALELQSRGYRVTIATSGVYKEKIESEGIGFHGVRPHMYRGDIDPELIKKIMDIKTGPEYVIRGLMLPHVRESYEDLEPILSQADLVVTHPLTFASHLYAEKYNTPWVSTVLQPSVFFSAIDPPIFPNAPILHRLRWLGPGFYRWAYSQIRKVIAKWMTPVHELRRDIGLPPTTRDPLLDSEFSPQLNLALFSPVFAPLVSDWPPNTKVTGFPIYDRRTKGEGMPEDLLKFLDDGQPPIVFTLGSSAVHDPGAFYADSIKASVDLGRRSVLLVGLETNETTEKLPEGIFLCRYAPHSDLFPRACAIVHQGGVGTTAQALRSGRPTLIVPWGQDQPDNASRIVRLGVGRTIMRAQYNASTAAHELGRLLSEGAYSYRAKEISKKILAEDGTRAAVDEIEAMLSTVPEPSTA